MTDRDRIPGLGEIATYWRRLDERGELRVIFGDIYFGDWGEPFCFRCKWQAPVRDWSEMKEKLRRHPAHKERSDDGWLALAWEKANGWLERCHLQDHCYGGSEDASNMVPMCPACHRWQPECYTRDEGVAYVSEQVRAPLLANMQYLRGGPRVQGRSETFFRYLALSYQAAYEELVEAIRDGEYEAVRRSLPPIDAKHYLWPFSAEHRARRSS